MSGFLHHHTHWKNCSRLGVALKLGEPGDGGGRRVLAHFGSGAKSLTDEGTRRVAEEKTAMIGGELNAADPGGFAIGHAGDG